MSYHVELSDRAKRKLKSLSRDVQNMLLAEITELGTDPHPFRSVKMQGVDCYRLRVGNYRVVYAIYDDVLFVLVLNLGHRKSVYDRKELEAVRKELKRRQRDG